MRPTPDRVRETLFNWLTPYLGGARCLDLYTGSGALTFEALSRGAASALALDRDARATAAMKALSRRLGAEQLEVRTADALKTLAAPAHPFDIVFVDPPFGSDLLDRTLRLLERGWLGPQAVVYVETAHADSSLPAPWRVLKSGTTREISYALIDRRT